MRLFLCEKPSQASDLARVLACTERGDGYMKNAATSTIVTFAVGHLLHQAEPEQYDARFGRPWRLDVLPVLPSPWQYVPDPKTEKQLNVVARLMKQAKELVIATDADREGEVIARNVIAFAGYRGPMLRLWVSDSTAAGIKKALSAMKPAASTDGLYASGIGRQRADWVAGMNLTRALTVAFANWGTLLNFGRVQTPTLALVVRRERAIAKFVASPYFTIKASFLVGEHPDAVPMRWQAAPGQLDANNRLVDPTIAAAVVARVAKQQGTVDLVEKERKEESPPLLYDLGALQRECSSRFGMSPDKTLSTVQSLYETHKLLTYPRTDCEYVAEEMYPDAPRVLGAIGAVHPELTHVVSEVTAKPLRAPTRAFNTKRVAASAHHAIIPTQSGNARLDALKPQEQQVYNLVARRYLSQFMPNHSFDETRVHVSCAQEKFVAIGRVVVEPGWKSLYPQAQVDEKSTAKKKSSRTNDDETENDDGTVALPPILRGEQAVNVEIEAVKKLTKPPKRYTEATLLSAMESIDKEIDDPRLASIMKNKEKAGIGTSATRGEILKRLFVGEYLELEKKAVKPTQKGTAIIELMERVCPSLVDLALTAIWESALSEVETGALSLEAFEHKINQFVTQAIERVRASASTSSTSLKIGESKAISNSSTGTTYPCSACNGSLRQRSSSRGLFWGCSNYPTCKVTVPDEDGRPGSKSPKSQRESGTARSSHVGGSVGSVCPTCKAGKLTQKATKDGKPFMACTTFPACRHFVWIN